MEEGIFKKGSLTKVTMFGESCEEFVIVLEW